MKLRVSLELNNARAHMVISDVGFVGHVGSGSHPLLRLSMVAASSLVRMKTEKIINLLFLSVRRLL